jgi:DNA polymerase-3 subunit delta'
MRIIGVDAVHALMGQLQMTSAVAARKVAILHEADRMNLQSANLFLKTLEEPPAHSMILMLSARPYALLPTIRSRTLHFRFPGSSGAPPAEGWEAWISDYRTWLGKLTAGISGKKAAAEAVFGAYGLAARFSSLIEKGSAAAWEARKASLPASMDEDELEALEVGESRGLRARLFAEIERTTRDFAMTPILAGDAGAGRAFTGAIDTLEHVSRLLVANLNESAALEDFLLASLRLWTQR